MLRTVSWLALPGRALSAGFDGGISPPFQFVAAELLGGWVPTETGLSPASHSRLLWTHEYSRTRSIQRGSRSMLKQRPPPSRQWCEWTSPAGWRTRANGFGVSVALPKVSVE